MAATMTSTRRMSLLRRGEAEGTGGMGSRLNPAGSAEKR
jgi:hypothetical protein